MNWAEKLIDFRRSLREKDLVFVSASPESMAAHYNGQLGRITGFWPEGWVVATIDGISVRFRPDELQAL